MKHRTWTLAATLLLIVGSPFSTCQTFAEEARTDLQVPEQRLAMLESRLLDAESVRFDFTVTAEGAVGADLTGSASWSDGHLSLTAEGTFAGEPMTLEARTTDDGRLVGGRVAQTADGEGAAALRFDIPTPAHWREAVALGFTRMGILHNLAMLSAGQPIDHATSGVGDWLRLERISHAAPDDHAAPGVVFDLFVADTLSAKHVSLRIDDAGHPTIRRQSVDFPNGAMHVTERYSQVAFGD